MTHETKYNGYDYVVFSLYSGDISSNQWSHKCNVVYDLRDTWERTYPTRDEYQVKVENMKKTSMRVYKNKYQEKSKTKAMKLK